MIWLSGARPRGAWARIGELLRALCAVTQGGSLIDPKVVETLVERRRLAERSPLAELTPRELDVLHAMAQGRTNKGIGETLFLSESSVEKHVAAIFGKLGLAQEAQVHRRVTAVLTFLRERT